MVWLCALLPALAELPAVDEPADIGDRHPSDAAVVVGIEDYFALPDVPYAEHDATAVYRYLLRTRGIPADRIRWLPSGANREQILAAVDEVGRKVGRGGTAWLYFAGHGATDPETGDRLLLGVDAQSDPTAFAPRGLRLSEAREALRSGGGSAALWIDACYTGAGRDGQPLTTGTRFAVPAYATTPAAGTIEWSAAGPGELANPLHGPQHGAFTYLALGALRGWADGATGDARDGVVTPEEANAYVLSGLGALQLNEQHPQLIGDTTARAWATGATESPPHMTAEDLAPAPKSGTKKPAPPVAETADKVLADVKQAFSGLGQAMGSDVAPDDEVAQVGRASGSADPAELESPLATRLNRELPPTVTSIRFDAYRSRSAFNPDTLTVNATAVLRDGTSHELLLDKLPLAARPDWSDVAARVVDTFVEELSTVAGP